MSFRSIQRLGLLVALIAQAAIWITVVSTVAYVEQTAILGAGASPGFHSRAIGAVRSLYGVDRNVRFVSADDDQVLCSLIQNCSGMANLPIGFGIVNADMKTRQRFNDSLTFIPVAGTGIALVHNVQNLTAPLVLSHSLLGRIFRQCEDPTNSTLLCAGTDYVDLWNHTDILQLNPGQANALSRAGRIKLILGPNGSGTNQLRQLLEMLDPLFAQQMRANPEHDPWKNIRALRRLQIAFQTLVASADEENGALGYLPMDLALSSNEASSLVGLTSVANNRELAVFPTLQAIRIAMEETLQIHTDYIAGPMELKDCYPLSFLQFLVFPADSVANGGRRLCDVSEYLLNSFLKYELDDEALLSMARHFLVSQTIEHGRAQYDVAKTKLNAGCSNLQVVDKHFPKFRIYVQAGHVRDPLYEMMDQLIMTYSDEVRRRIPDTAGVPLDIQLNYFNDATKAFDIASSPAEFGEVLEPFASMPTSLNEDVETPALVVAVTGAHNLDAPANDHSKVTLALVPMLVMYNLCGDSLSCLQNAAVRPLDMNVEVVTAILLGEITMWNDPRISAGGDRTLPAQPIRVVNPPLNDGIRFAMEAVLTAANGNRSFTFNPAFDAPSRSSRHDILQAYVEQTQFSFTVTIPSLHSKLVAAEVATVFGVRPTVDALYRCASDTYQVMSGDFHSWLSEDAGCYKLGLQIDLVVKKEFKGRSCVNADVETEFPVNASLNTAFVHPPPQRPSSPVFELQKFIEWLFGERRNLPAHKQQLISGVRTEIYPYQLRQMQKRTGNVTMLANGLDPVPLFTVWAVAPMFDLAILVEKVSIAKGMEPIELVGEEFRQVVASRYRLLTQVKCHEDTNLSSASAAVTEIIETLNHIPDGVIIFGLVLTAMSITGMCLMAVWIGMHLDYRIVHFSSPVFLYLIILGGIISQLTVIPLSMQDGTFLRSYGIEQNELAMLDAACQAMPFLFTSGFAIAFGSLLAKTWRMARIFNLKLARVKLTNAKIAIIPMLLCLAFFILNVVWLLGPQRLRWDRYPLVVQYDDLAVLSSVGFCTVSAGDPWVAMAPQLILIGLCLVTAMTLAHRVRNLATEFQESNYIFIALGFLLQNFIIAVPVLALASSSSVASYFLKLLVIFVNSFVVVALLMVPKMYIVHVLKDSKAAQKTNSDQAHNNSRTNTKQDYDGSTSKNSRDAIAATAVVSFTNPKVTSTRSFKSSDTRVAYSNS